MNTVSHDLKQTIAVAMIAVLCPLSFVHAQQEDRPNRVSLSAGAGWEDNVLRTAGDAVESIYYVYGLSADLEVRRPNLDVTLDSDLQFFEYDESEVRDRPVGDLFGRLTYRLSDERLQWFLENDFTQLRANPTVGDTPDNLQEINIVRSGLQGRVPLSGRFSLWYRAAAGLREGQSELDLDSDEVVLQAGMTRRISNVRTLSFIAESSEYEYDDRGELNYDIQRLIGRYASRLAGGEASLSLGANRLERLRDDGDWSPLIQAEWEKQLTARTRVDIAATHQLTDFAGSIGARGFEGDRLALQTQLAATPSPLDETRVSVTASTELERTSLQLSGSFANQQYKAPLVEDNTALSMSLSATRRVSERFRIGTTISATQQELKQSGAESLDATVSVNVTRRLGARGEIELTLAHQTRDDDFDTGFDSSRAALTYRFLLVD